MLRWGTRGREEERVEREGKLGRRGGEIQTRNKIGQVSIRIIKERVTGREHIGDVRTDKAWLRIPDLEDEKEPAENLEEEHSRIPRGNGKAKAMKSTFFRNLERAREAGAERLKEKESREDPSASSCRVM